MKTTLSIFSVIFYSLVATTVQAQDGDGTIGNLQICSQMLEGLANTIGKALTISGVDPIQSHGFGLDIGTVRLKMAHLNPSDEKPMREILESALKEGFMLDPEPQDFVGTALKDLQLGAVRKNEHSSILATAIYLKSTNEPIGAAWVYHYNESLPEIHHGHGTVGLSLVFTSRRFMASGLQKEALKGLIGAIKTHPEGYKRIIAVSHVRNFPYVRLLTGNGFIEESAVEEHPDFMYYSLEL